MKKPWNLRWIMYILFFLSWFFIGIIVIAGLLAYFNYSRLGKPEEKKKVILYTSLGIIPLIIIVILQETFPLFLPLHLPLLLMIIIVNYWIIITKFLQNQLKAYTEWKLKYEFGNKREGSDIVTEIKNDSKIRRRPILITLLCILGFLILGLGLLAATWCIIFPEHQGNPIIWDLHEVGPILVLTLILTLILIFVGFIGYWKMQKWGLYVQLIATIINIGRCFFLTNEIYDIFTALISIIIISIGYTYFKQMT